MERTCFGRGSEPDLSWDNLQCGCSWRGFQWHNAHSYFVWNCSAGLWVERRGIQTRTKTVFCLIMPLPFFKKKKWDEAKSGHLKLNPVNRPEGLETTPRPYLKKMHHDTTAREEIHLRRKWGGTVPVWNCFISEGWLMPCAKAVIGYLRGASGVASQRWTFTIERSRTKEFSRRILGLVFRMTQGLTISVTYRC